MILYVEQEESNRGKPNWEHLNDELHVLITVEDTANRAAVKIERAIQEVRKLLIPVTDGEDELKKRQLMELAIINGTYRDSSNRNGKKRIRKDNAFRKDIDWHASSFYNLAGEGDATRGMMQPQLSLQPLTPTRSPASLGHPLIIPAHMTGRHIQALHQQMMQSVNGNAPPPLIPADGSGLIYASPYEAFHHHYAMASPQHLLAEYPATTNHGTPGSESLTGSGTIIAFR